MYNSDGLNTYYPYYLLIEVKEDTARYQADYSWGNLTSTLQSFSVPQSHTDLKRSAEFNARTPSDEALAAARAAGYKFAGWEISGTGYTSGNVVQPDGKVSIRGGDLTLTAKWILKTFTVTWKSQDGNTTYETDTDVAYDSAPSFDTTEPTKAEDAQYAYEFAGWSTTMGAESGKSVDELDKVTSNITYYAAFSKTPKTFTVTWKSQDGNTTYETDTDVAYDSAPSFDTTEPTKAEDAQYAYEFAGWSTTMGAESGKSVDELDKVTSNITYYAAFSKTPKTFTVTWKSQDGNTTYETDTDVAYDSAPSFDTTEPTKAEDAQYAYEFAGWSTTMGAESGKSVDELDKVTSNITYYAAFSKTPKTFTVTWKSQDGNDTYESDSGLAYNSTPSFDAADPTKADDAQYTYTFVGWSTSMNSETGSSVADLPNVTTNVTYYAAFSKTPKTFTVTWVNWNGDLLEKDEDVKYNSTPSYDGKTPTRPASGRYTYTFNGWTPALSPVTDDITYTATYKSTYHRPSTPSKPTVEIPDDDALGLNTTDHFAYIVGYGNGEVRPQNNITRAEVATIFFRLLTDDVRDENLTKTNRYSDVTRADWYNTAVSTLSSMGIITGYPDGTFRPNAAITRAEFAAIAARFDNDGDKTAAKFSDIATHWAKDEISIAYNNGWITGYPDGTFGPQRDITRAETMTLVNRVLNRQPETEDDLLPNMTVWTDNANPNAWYYLAVQEATNSHYYKFKTNSKYEKWTELRETRDWTLLEK